MKLSSTLRWLPYVVAALFGIYIALSVVQLAPLWDSMSSEQSFSVAKHLVVLAGISIFVCVNPRIGSWIALVWGLFVPIERYSHLFSSISQGTLSQAFSPLDVSRLVVLLIATLSAAVLAYVVFQFSKASQPSGANADA